MATHGNSGMGMSKHRSSGKSQTNRRGRLGGQLADTRKGNALPIKPATEQHDSVSELFESTRKRKRRK